MELRPNVTTQMTPAEQTNRISFNILKGAGRYDNFLSHERLDNGLDMYILWFSVLLSYRLSVFLSSGLDVFE